MSNVYDSTVKEVCRCLRIWDKIEEILETDRPDYVVVEETVKMGGLVASLDRQCHIYRIGFDHGFDISGEKGVMSFIVEISKYHKHL
jgi:hypothetical protein